jgi:hypothetical protein
MRRSIVAVAIAALPLMLPGTALACSGDKVLLAEDFSFPDAAWGEGDKNFAIKDGAVTIRADLQKGYKTLNNAFLFEDADICVTVTAVEVSKPEDSAAGLAFWAKDFKNAHFLLLASNGYVKVGRLVNGSWVNPPFDWSQSDAVRQGVNQPNRLRLTIKGQSLAIEVNGKSIVRLQGQSPGAPALIGLYGESSDKIDTWKFDDLKVTNVK